MEFLNKYVDICLSSPLLVNCLCRLIKDFYLLGRGELYLEFIRKTYMVQKAKDTAPDMRDFAKAFEVSETFVYN